MLLVIDVGNTNIVLGVYDGEELVAHWRMSTSDNQTADEIGIFIHSLFDHSDIDINEIDDAIIASVVPTVMYSLTHGLRKYLKLEPIIVEAGIKTGINLLMENPKEMGETFIILLNKQ